MRLREILGLFALYPSVYWTF